MSVPSPNRCVLAFALLSWSLACAAEEGDGDATAADTHGEHDSHGEHAHDTSGTTESEGGTTTEAEGPSESGAELSSGAAESSTSAGSSSTGAAAGDTWESWALPSYFQPYCIECHPGQSQRDFTDYDIVVENVEHIRCGSAPETVRGCDGHIEPGHLPIGDGPYPTDDERWRLVDWIDAGMLRDP